MTGPLMRHTMAVRNPLTLQAVALVEGTECPDWARELVHVDDLYDPTGAPVEPLVDPTAPPVGKAYGSWTVPQLEAEVARRNEGRGEDEKVTVGGKGNKPDLVAALTDDDVVLQAAALLLTSQEASGAGTSPEPSQPASETAPEPVQQPVRPADPEPAPVAEVVDRSSWTVAKLLDEVTARNEGRADDAKVTVGGNGNKPDLLAALTADDAYLAGASGASS